MSQWSYNSMDIYLLPSPSNVDCDRVASFAWYLLSYVLNPYCTIWMNAYRDVAHMGCKEEHGDCVRWWCLHLGNFAGGRENSPRHHSLLREGNWRNSECCESSALATGAWDTACHVMGIPYSEKIKILGVKLWNTVKQSALAFGRVWRPWYARRP